MASGTLTVDELPRVRHKWSEFRKVYTRKFYRNPKNNITNNNHSNSSTITVGPDDGIFIETNDRTHVETNDRTHVETNDKTPRVRTNDGVVVEPNESASVEVNDRTDIETNKTPHAETNNSVVVEPDDNVAVKANIRADTKMNDKTPHVEINDGVVVEPDDSAVVEAHDRADIEMNDGDDVEGMKKAYVEGNGGDDVVTSNGTVVENNEGEHVGDARTSSGNTEEIVIEEKPERNSPQSTQPVGEGNSSQPRQNSLCVENVTLSEDSSCFNRVENVPLSNGHLVNGVVREEKKLVGQVDDRLNISMSASKSKEQVRVRDLKRKLEAELDQVRKMARKLEAKEAQLNGVSFCMEAPVVGRLPEIPLADRFPEVPFVDRLPEVPFVDRLPEVPFVDRMPEVPVMGRSDEPSIVDRMWFPISGGMENYSVGMRVNQDYGSIDCKKSRPFRQLSVSLMENNYGIGDVVEKEKRTPKANKFYRNSDFILGKEKLPRAESYRKSKSSGGGKHSAGDFTYDIDKKIFKKCGGLVEKLRKHKHAWVFNQPVDVKGLGLHDYFNIIKHPMDLGTVNTRLANNWYTTPREFAEDVRRTFHNAMTYNPEGQDVHIMARDMLKSFEDKWSAIEADYERKLRYEMMRDLGTPAPTSRKTYASAHVPIHMPPPPLLQPPPFQEARHLDRSQSMPVRREVMVKATTRTPALKKPKAKDPNKRVMTFEEKQKLSLNLQSLPSEKLGAIVQIIKKRNSALSQHDDEIEVDIDNVDTETLWELDRFVTNYKKCLSKHKRKAEIAAVQAAAAAAAKAAQPTNPTPSSTEAPRELAADGGNVAPSPHVQQERQSNIERGSSSSSGSSSDSRSSSSDSDSDSSSSSDSE